MDISANMREQTTGTGPYLARPGLRPAKPVSAEQRSLALILELIRTGDANTRLELERVSGLGRAIVADRLARLSELGLIDEGETGPASGGRAPRNSRFNELAGLFMVAILRQSTIGIALADLSGRLLIEHHEASDTTSDPGPILKRLCTLFDWAREQQSKDQAIWGIGITVEGAVEPSEGQPFTSPSLPFMPNWDGFRFVEKLVARYETPVWVRSSTQMMTLGELRSGIGTGVLDMLYVDLGQDISAGIVCDGRLYRGAQGGAGLIGHIAVSDDPQFTCKCGNIGCLEALAGSDALVRAAMRAVQEGRSPLLAEVLAANTEITTTDIAATAVIGDAFCAELLARTGRLVGYTLAALTNSYNPSLIVLGGALAQSSDILLAAVREAVYRRSHPLVSRDLRIVRSQMGSSAALVGAAISVADETFEPHTLSAWVNFASPLKHPDVRDLIKHTKHLVGNIHNPPMPPAPHQLPALNP